MRFKEGDKVIVKSFSKRPQHWNPYGKMDKYMGKVVTIRNINVHGAIKIEEAKEENSGEGWIWFEEDFLSIPKPGDKVRLRTWEDMEKQYGLYVVEDMRQYCGRVVTVSSVNEEAEYLHIEDDSNCWTWCFCDIEEVYPKEEDKMEKITKDMLKSGEHVVEYRNGSKRLYLNGNFIGPNKGSRSCNYTNDLRNTGDAALDIMAVYRASDMLTFEGILSFSNELIWKRDDEPIEIPATEAFAQLREIYGKEVKIVEDKYD